MQVFRFLTIAFLFFSLTVKAQLNDFNLEVTKTDETCLSNGSLTFEISNETEGSDFIFKVYLLPNVTNPVSILTDNYLGGLSAGNYRVEAIQALGEFSNSAEFDITINENIVPFEISISSDVETCSVGGEIIVDVVSGIASAFEIISGPEIRPLQSSNVFSGLQTGTYNIRAFNECGVAKVKTHSITVLTFDIEISDPIYPDEVSIVCDSIRVNNIITATSGSIRYPLAIQHSVNTMDIGGDTLVINQIFENGPEDELEVSAVLPRYITESYTYELKVTDYCNSVYEKDDNVVDPDIEIEVLEIEAPCAEKFFSLSLKRYVGPYTVEFLNYPAEFNPEDYNTTPYGPFEADSIQYGNVDNSVPFGEYVIKVTDACGREKIESATIEFEKPTPLVYGRNNGCFSEYGRIRAEVPESMVVNATIIDAPSTYTLSIPQNVTANISSSGILLLYDIPIGDYTIEFTDDCGFNYVVNVEVPPFVEQEFAFSVLPACNEGLGSVNIRSGNGILTEVLVISAPEEYNQSLPTDVSYNIVDSKFYMTDLPEGSYIFRATNICGITDDISIELDGYLFPEDSFQFTPNCGSFSVKVTDTSNGTEGAKYWLQKFDNLTGNWVHPSTNTTYIDGEIPNENTGIRLRNNTVKNNLYYTGTFRILKQFQTFSNGSAENTICISELGQMEYYEGLSINTAYTLACIGNPNDVYVEVSGHPISYKIIKKDGVDFTLDNGTSNIFRNLEPAEYVISVEDGCGNIVTQWLNFQELPSIAAVTQPQDMIICSESGSVTEGYMFDLTSQNDKILGPLHPSMYTITYHLTQEDAEEGVNELPDNYENIANGQTIYVRLIHNEIEICHSVTSFRLFIGEYQEPVIATTGTICNDGQLMLSASPGYVSYLWSTGETTRTIFVNEPGLYTVIVEKAYGTAVCDGYNEIEIKESETPEILHIDVKDWTENNNSITVDVKGEGEYEYSIDGFNYQDSNTFNNLPIGVYQVYVKDKYGCGEDVKEVVIMYYPKYFTPNGDGVHDKWYIKHAILEPDFNVEIYDRYGKMVSTFGHTSDGWDGTFEGAQLPSTDYWFVVTRQDGRVLRGHFAMLR
ncbi:T9SS type B sorting domain-containing protein [Flavobacterium suaedae]|nr:T9SS type B sorting domain-containing protein [Flavobacterium suaedae]